MQLTDLHIHIHAHTCDTHMHILVVHIDLFIYTSCTCSTFFVFDVLAHRWYSIEPVFVLSARLFFIM